MKEIKFKAYDKETKEVWPETEHGLTIGGDGRIWQYYDRRDQIGFDNVTDKYIILFYTGLKDKNGKEIYEGDVLKYFGKWDVHGNVVTPDFDLHEVIWSMGGFWAVPLSSKFDSNPKDWKGVGHTECEIVISIYTNPEIK
jgi:uncharacterized phage protein (TIGR01671 family)